MEISKRYQRLLLEGRQVAYCGTEGAFAYIAADHVFPGCTKVAYPSFAEAYKAVVSGECDSVVLPVENSFAGDVGSVMDLMFSGDLVVTAMYDLPVVHDLLGTPDATIEDITTVVSHPQALSQCSGFIKSKGLRETQFSNTALAAKQVADNKDKTVAAIASGETAELFGLKILASRINESDTNTTHFAVLSRSKDDTPPQNIDGRFTLMFTVRNEAGSLARAVNIIGTHGFNMRTLRSRPMKDLLWEYYFYVECEGIISSPDGMRCLRELEVCCSKLKVLGEYKMIAYTKPDRKA